MKRIIKDYKNLTPEIFELIEAQYPNGYNDAQLMSFVNSKGEFIKAIEVKADEVIYLIKMDRQMDNYMSELEDEDTEYSNEDSEIDFGDSDFDDSDD